MNRKDIQIFLLLQERKAKGLLKIFKLRDWPRIFVFVGFVALFVVLAYLTFFFSKNTFLSLLAYPQFIESMLFYILASFFFLLFILTVLSSTISAISVLFDQEDDDLLSSLPIKPGIIFKSRFLSLTLLASWPIIIFGLPLLLGLNRSLNIGFISLVLACLTLLLFIPISSFVAALIAILVTSSAGRLAKTIINVTGVVCLPAGAWWVSGVLIPRELFLSFEKLEISQVAKFLSSLPLASNLFPSTWAVNFILFWKLNPYSAFVNLGRIFALLLALALVVFFLVNRKYYLALAQAKVGRFIAGPQDKSLPSFSRTSFPYFLKGVKGAFAEKDILTLVRNQAEVLQFAFILFIGILYFMLISKIPLEKIIQNLSLYSINYLDFLAGINFNVLSFLLALFALRFIFPAFSIEGQTGWLIWSAPFSKAKIFWQKLLGGWLILGLISGVASFASATIFKFSFSAFLNNLFLLLTMSLALSAINLATGAIFPNFTEKNPEKISTSFGGILATFLSILYIFAVNIFLLKFGSGTTNLGQSLIWVGTIMVVLLISPVSLRKIDKYEF